MLEDNMSDPSEGPLYGIWHIDGHGYQWQLDQINAGLPFEPCIRMFKPHLIVGNEDVVRQFNGMSIQLRMDNLRPQVCKTIPRVRPLTEENWHFSTHAVRRRADGSLDDQGVPSPFAGTDGWYEAGKLWAESPWLKQIQELIQNPMGIILRDNNEGPDIKYSDLIQTSNCRVLLSDGRVVQPPADPDLDTDRLCKPDGSPYEDDWLFVYGGEPVKWRATRWKHDDELDSFDLHAKSFVGPRRDTSPFLDEHREYFDSLQEAQYNAVFAAFEGHLPGTWQGVVVRTVGYSGGGHHDVRSQGWYPGHYVSIDITDPEYVERKQANLGQGHENIFPPDWSELSVSCNYIERAAYTGALNGNCGVMDAESYAGWMAHLCWWLQSTNPLPPVGVPRKEIRLTEWLRYVTLPDKLAFSESGQEILRGLGRDDLVDLTIEDYEIAVLKEMERIHRQPLTRYWQDGQTTLLDSTDNDAQVNRVWSTLTTIPGKHRRLLAVYTPCTEEQLPEMHTAEFRVPWSKGLAYYLTDPLELVEDDVTPPTVEERLDAQDRRLERLEREVFGE